MTKQRPNQSTLMTKPRIGIRELPKAARSLNRRLQRGPLAQVMCACMFMPTNHNPWVEYSSQYSKLGHLRSLDCRMSCRFRCNIVRMAVWLGLRMPLRRSEPKVEPGSTGLPTNPKRVPWPPASTQAATFKSKSATARGRSLRVNDLFVILLFVFLLCLSFFRVGAFLSQLQGSQRLGLAGLK